MQQCGGVYLHGFLSSGNSQKGQWLKQRLKNVTASNNQAVSCKLFTPSYSMQNPSQSVDFLQAYIEDTGLPSSHVPWFLIGSSMGGFYAQYLAQQYRVPYIMINPALDPVGLMKDYMGEHQNPYSGETIIIDETYRNDLANYYCKPNDEIPCLLLLDEKDEVIPYRQSYEMYRTGNPNHVTRLFNGGSHAFEHMSEAEEEIRNFLKKSVTK
ncbi:YqiA/YcfP family alpha/beta fold hydrolase [Thiomicrorhabdus sp. ZW0627]|uniref:YqiA/YcfP family alpha/beta fold hydrolase n=1 Tax=Thiomicrorhabdus sp. ZW0627 TaxID=3039774 RepID=UPI002436C699|nr:YqiA/YcfP family alpha/beta fold hydrolase [Thiomicrorhabdus sp. ZW0627]MDG6772963.1 YqiA/YcfP family alpha/beta fold hydrolase [Thiomicrorhabdus sp. ZW0627]